MLPLAPCCQNIPSPCCSVLKYTQTIGSVMNQALSRTVRVEECFIACPCNMIDIFIITNTMHTIGVDKITLFKTI